MKQMNGFFSIVIKNDGTYLSMVPNSAGGAKLDINEITDYLTMIRVTEYSRTELLKDLKNLTEPKEVKLNDQQILPEQEMVKITIINDSREVIARFYPPSTGGNHLTKKDISNVAISKGMKFGLKEDVIDEFIEHPVYCTDIVIAEAMLPVEGRNAEIEYKFNTTFTRAPKLNEDGTVDFHQIDIINHVRAGDLIAELHPVVYGKPGIDVCGKVIKPNTVHNKFLKHGNKIRVSEDGLRLYSEVDGHVSLVGDKVYVSDLYEIPSNIDLSTGDITYQGSITIKGNVLTGFTVKATGNIFVEGVVEGCTLISDASIILKRGIQGMNRGKLIAKGDVVAKFIENATVECEGAVTAEAILHSKVYAGREIVVDSKKGYVTGGELHAGSLIRVKNAGSTMGTSTVLEVGNNPKTVLEYQRIEKRISEINKEIKKLKQVVDLFQQKFQGKIPVDKLTSYLKVKETYDRYTAELEEDMEEYDQLSEKINENVDASIVVDKTIYSGCKLLISNIVYYVRDEMFAKKFVNVGADIKALDHA